jgi:DNA-binding response OmpR family regulator
LPDNRCVLVIDDAPDIRLLVRTVLTRHGWEVVETDSGPDGCAILHERKIAIVLLDIQTPGQDGWTTLAQIRDDPDTAGVPVILCTVKSRRPDQIHGWDLGCDGFLTKPFSIDQLLDEVNAVAGRSASDRLAVRQFRLANLTSLEEVR